MKKKLSLPLALLIFLSLEKFIQHMFVTYAFAVDMQGIRSTVVVDHRILMVTGFLVGLLFLANVPGLYHHTPRSRIVLGGLALFDFVGEFVAQGTLAIQITVSFLVATMILILLGVYGRQLSAEGAA